MGTEQGKKRLLAETVGTGFRKSWNKGMKNFERKQKSYWMKHSLENRK